MNKYLRKISFAALIVSGTVHGMAQNTTGSDSGMNNISGTGVEISYNKTGGKISDYITARAAYEFYSNRHISVSANARYHFMDTDFMENGNEEENVLLKEIGMDGSKSVYQLGVNSMMRTRLLGKPFVAIAMITSDFSKNGFERINFMGGGMFMLKMTQRTQFGLGAFLLINTPSKCPVLPMFIYSHKFTPSLALNLYGQTFGIDYTPTKHDKITAGFDITSRTFYFSPGIEELPERCRYSNILLRPMIKYRRIIAKGLHADIEAGEEVSIKSGIYGRNGTKIHKKIDQPMKPFVQVSLGYSM